MTTRDGVNAGLKAIGLGGLSGVSVRAPGVTQGLDILLSKTCRGKNYLPQRIINEFKRQGLVHVTAHEDRISYTLTPAGAYRLQKLTMDELTIDTPKKWDKKWRGVTFDVPVQFSKQRAAFVQRLHQLGFRMLQKSVWVYPYPSLDKVEKLAGYYNVLRYCTLFELDYVDEISQRRLMRHFKTIKS